VLAVAAGFWADELSYRGIEPSARSAEFRTRLGKLRAGLSGGLLSPAPRTPGGPPVWLAGGQPTMRLAAAQGLAYQCSRALPDELEPYARRWHQLGGGLLAHRIYIEAGAGAPDGAEVARHALSGSATELLAGFRAYQKLGVDDLSLVLGHDDKSAQRTLAVLTRVVLPALSNEDG
jgi:hypothetical protein